MQTYLSEEEAAKQLHISVIHLRRLLRPAYTQTMDGRLNGYYWYQDIENASRQEKMDL